MERTEAPQETTPSSLPVEPLPSVADYPEYWHRVDSPFSKTQIYAYAGGLLGFGAICGAAAAVLLGQRPPKPKQGVVPPPHTPVKISPSSAVFALKALAGGTVACLSGALVVRWVVYKSMGVSSIEEFADKMRSWAPEKARKVGLTPSRESAYWTKRRLEEGGQGEEAVGVFEQWFGIKFDDSEGEGDGGGNEGVRQDEAST